MQPPALPAFPPPASELDLFPPALRSEEDEIYHGMIDELLREYHAGIDTRPVYWGYEPSSLETGAEIFNAPDAVKSQIAAAAVMRLERLEVLLRLTRERTASPDWPNTDKVWGSTWGRFWTYRAILFKLVRDILAAKPGVTKTFREQLCRWCLTAGWFDADWFPVRALVEVLEHLHIDAPAKAETRERDAAVLKLLTPLRNGDHSQRQLVQRVERLVDPSAVALTRGEAWADAATADVGALPDKQITRWNELLESCRSTTGAAPSAKWIKSVKALLDQLGPDTVRAALVRCFHLRHCRAALRH